MASDLAEPPRGALAPGPAESVSERVHAVWVELIAHTLRGERAAGRLLADALRPSVEASVARELARRGLSTRRARLADPDDLTQGVFVFLLENDGRILRRWDPERGLGLRGFVALVATRWARTVLRSARRCAAPEISMDEEALDMFPARGTEPEVQVIARETCAAVADAVKVRLGSRGVELFRQAFLRDDTMEDICSAGGMTPNAVYSWKCRIRRIARDDQPVSTQPRAHSTPCTHGALRRRTARG